MGATPPPSRVQRRPKPQRRGLGSSAANRARTFPSKNARSVLREPASIAAMTHIKDIGRQFRHCLGIRPFFPAPCRPRASTVRMLHEQDDESRRIHPARPYRAGRQADSRRGAERCIGAHHHHHALRHRRAHPQGRVSGRARPDGGPRAGRDHRKARQRGGRLPRRPTRDRRCHLPQLQLLCRPGRRTVAGRQLPGGIRPLRLPWLQGDRRLALRQPDRRHPGRVCAGSRRSGQPCPHTRWSQRRTGADVSGHHVHGLQGRGERQHPHRR